LGAQFLEVGTLKPSIQWVKRAHAFSTKNFYPYFKENPVLVSVVIGDNGNRCEMCRNFIQSRGASV
jgi:ureidoglycolate hydrolase